MRRAKHGERIDLAPIHQLAQDQAGLDRLADADVVGDEQPRHRQAKRHQQGDELVGPRLEGELRRRAERACAAAQRQTHRVRQQRGLRLDGRERRRQADRSAPASTGTISSAGSRMTVSLSPPERGRSARMPSCGDRQRDPFAPAGADQIAGRKIHRHQAGSPNIEISASGTPAAAVSGNSNSVQPLASAASRVASAQRRDAGARQSDCARRSSSPDQRS